MVSRFLTIVMAAASACAGADPAWETLDRAYRALQKQDYDAAAEGFRRSVALAPERADIRKDLAYTYLKIGETELARDQFAEAVRLSPSDNHVALEYAFLCHETKQEAEAYRIFRRLRDAEPTAKVVFERLDNELIEGIDRWTKAVEMAPGSYSAHEELARLTERRGNNAVAAAHYLEAWKLRPSERKYLLDLGRVWQGEGRPEQATAALLAASRGAEPRVAELARALLPSRYPWVYEFRAALALDDSNLPLRRELAFLLIEMGQRKEAETEFAKVVETDPKDGWAVAQLGFLCMARGAIDDAMPLLERALTSDDEELRDRVRSALKMPRELRKRPDTSKVDAAAEALRLADKSFDAGYLKDAIRYLRIAHENDPLNFAVIVKLGWAYNLLHEDRDAVDWFGLARRSPDPAIATPAHKAWNNLRTQYAATRTTVWMYPMYSTRWHDLFSWAQLKTEFHPRWKIYPYLSVRFAGDVRRTAQLGNASLTPAYLSESAVTFAAGFSTRTVHGLRAWMEAGYAFSYLPQGDSSRIRPDIRGGLSYSRTVGRNLGAERSGLFAETNLDALYISRFDRDTIVYAQNRAGFTIRQLGLAQLQFTWNFNMNMDARRFAWANTFETGPGMRLKLTALPQPILLSVDLLSGRYTILDGSRPPQYSDLRIGLWYAFSR